MASWPTASFMSLSRGYLLRKVVAGTLAPVRKLRRDSRVIRSFSSISFLLFFGFVSLSSGIVRINFSAALTSSNGYESETISVSFLN